jgi:glycosyltransferase involved in cell wall biosynthesis
VLDALGHAACVVVPSRGPENAPLAAIEAMAMGRPLIVARVGGLPEMVNEGEAGIVVAAGDAEALAQAIDRVVTDQGLAARLGSAGRRRAVTQLSLEAHLDRLIALYQEVGTSGRSPGSLAPAGVSSGSPTPP